MQSVYLKMDESVNMDSDTFDKSDDNRKCISQNSAKFSIDSLLATTEKVQVVSDIHVGNVQCSDIKNCFQSDVDCEEITGQKRCNEVSGAECLIKESEVVSTTDGFYQRNYTEGKNIYEYEICSFINLIEQFAFIESREGV